LFTGSAPIGRAVVFSLRAIDPAKVEHAHIVTNRSVGKFLAGLAGGMLLLYLALPLIVTLVRAIDAGLLEQLVQPTVTQARAWR
jgi:hypothetical protein